MPRVSDVITLKSEFLVSIIVDARRAILQLFSFNDLFPFRVSRHHKLAHRNLFYAAVMVQIPVQFFSKRNKEQNKKYEVALCLV